MIYLLSIFILIFGCQKKENQKMNEEESFTSQRHSMVDSQIKSRGVVDEHVLNAMKKVPRHKFVLEELQGEAYIDDPLPIGESQTISQPYIVAYMTEQLELKKTDKVLEIGTGSGYQAAILAEIVDSVFTIEIIDFLAKEAEKTLKDLNYNNVFVKSGDGYKGWPSEAPFDAIIITAAPTKIPQPLVDQLNIGGRMILPLGNLFQELVLLTKTESGIQKKTLLPVRFVPMTGEIQNN
jgi:protein-L-isoaspartate(D-aspartate) O-methyltransferase